MLAVVLMLLAVEQMSIVHFVYCSGHYVSFLKVFDYVYKVLLESGVSNSWMMGNMGYVALGKLQ